MLPNTIKNTSIGNFISGVNAGLASTMIVTPVEYFKIMYQKYKNVEKVQ